MKEIPPEQSIPSMSLPSRTLQLVGFAPPTPDAARAAGDDAANDDQTTDDSTNDDAATVPDDDTTADTDSGKKSLSGAGTKSKGVLVTRAPAKIGIAVQPVAPMASLVTVKTPVSVSSRVVAPVPLSVAPNAARWAPTLSPVALNRNKKPSPALPHRPSRPLPTVSAAKAPQLPTRSRTSRPIAAVRPPVAPTKGHDASHASKPLPGAKCQSLFSLPCQVKSHPLIVVGVVVLLLVCLWRRRRGGAVVDGDRGEYRRVASRFTAEAFNDALDDDDLDGFVDDDDMDGGDYSNGTTKHTMLEMSELDHGRLSLHEVNG